MEEDFDDNVREELEAAERERLEEQALIGGAQQLAAGMKTEIVKAMQGDRKFKGPTEIKDRREDATALAFFFETDEGLTAAFRIVVPWVPAPVPEMKLSLSFGARHEAINTPLYVTVAGGRTLDSKALHNAIREASKRLAQR